MDNQTKEGQLASLLGDLRSRVSWLAWYVSKDMDKWDIETARGQLVCLDETLNALKKYVDSTD